MLRKFQILLVILAAIVPLVARAGFGHRHGGHCGRCARPFTACGCARPFCGACQMAPAQCNCGPVITPMPMMPAPVMVPQSTTYLRQEQVVTMQPVTRTEVRREAQVLDIPVTTQRQVTVDEGGYQTVWVPKLVAKNIVETTVQKQVQYRDVAYQVTQQVPVTTTRIVPSQVTTFVPQSAYTLSAISPVIIGSTPVQALGSTTALHQHDHHDHSHAEMAGKPVPIPDPYAAAAAQPVPSMASSRMSDASNDPSWQKVPQKTAGNSSIQLQSYEEPVSAPLAAGRFSPAPSAAAAWRAHSNMSAR
ncbi:hypothetical protein [Planctomicrobium piriforme]|uniref:Uncharacterized protein n=1 Tax=Planctomicrobium piriforme TaxID=1576369 RepID=A0A1I3EKZ2_9PLAN|nr:hypothetical protein [Planctomicrobium piriforme]SFH99654.1 hypothetical protein SAMN05421753_104271 [Planctomicrobium piriforme]